MFLTLWQRFLGNERLRRFTVLLFLVGVLYLARSMMSLILLTFIFSFLVISLNDAIRKKIDIPSKLIVMNLRTRHSILPCLVHNHIFINTFVFI